VGYYPCMVYRTGRTHLAVLVNSSAADVRVPPRPQWSGKEGFTVRALLVQSPATSPWVPRRQWEPPSIALATIAGQIDNHDVKIADMVVWRKKAVPRFLEALKQFRPDVVGFSAMTFQYDRAVAFA